MEIGVVFPQTEISEDPGAVREYAQAAEDLGYAHILAYDHVLGADISGRPGWRGPYTIDSLFHEVMVLFGYLSGLTRRIGFVTGILILPQRQTALVAKQAAEVDVLSGGRLRLGVGIGWNEVEYEALGENFRNRGARSEEQIEVLKLLLSQTVVTYHGRWHHIEAAGLKPMPMQRRVPIWLGGHADVVLRRAARLADGWFPQAGPAEARESIERLRTYAREAGREPEAIGIEGRLRPGQIPEGDWAKTVQAWRDVGATHLGIDTMGMELRGPEAHIGAIRRFKEAVG